MLVGTGVGVTGLLGAGSRVIADGHEIPVLIAGVNPTEETVVLENMGNETVDLGGYQLDWEYADDETQTDTFEQDVTIEAGAQLVVWTGFQSTQIEDVEYDYQIASYDQGRINDENPDVIAFLSPGGEVVATSDGEIQPPEPEPPDEGGDDGGSNESEESEETEEESQDDESETEDESEEETEEDSSEEAEEDQSEETDTEEKSEEEEESEEETEAEETTEDEESTERFPHEFEAHLSGEGHGIETDASGKAAFTVDTHDGEVDAHYELTVDSICNVTQAHIHLGAEDEDGPVVAWLYPEEGTEPAVNEGFFSGTLAEGTLTEGDLVNDWEDASIEEAEAALEEHAAYVNVHTEEYPAGEIRGQIESIDDS